MSVPDCEVNHVSVRELRTVHIATMRYNRCICYKNNWYRQGTYTVTIQIITFRAAVRCIIEAQAVMSILSWAACRSTRLRTLRVESDYHFLSLAYSTSTATTDTCKTMYYTLYGCKFADLQSCCWPQTISHVLPLVILSMLAYNLSCSKNCFHSEAHIRLDIAATQIVGSNCLYLCTHLYSTLYCCRCQV